MSEPVMGEMEIPELLRWKDHKKPANVSDPRIQPQRFKRRPMDCFVQCREKENQEDALCRH